MFMLTEGHWWTDRVEQPTDILQRERLGGVALKRNQTYPGNTVSWKFVEPGAAQKVAILIADATPTHFKVIAFNTTDQLQRATMTAWNVVAGKWIMKSGIDSTGVDRADSQLTAATLQLERSMATDVVFYPNTTTTIDFALSEKASTQPSDRPDLGIGADDIRLQKDSIAVTVHSLGALDSHPGRVVLHDSNGTIYATALIPPMKAPRLLIPQTAIIKLHLPAHRPWRDLHVRVSQIDDASEITMINNDVALAEMQ